MDKKNFSKIIKEIILDYNSISSFAEISSVDRTYLSKCINEKLDGPPSPSILRKIANATPEYTYIDLMYVCDYINDFEYDKYKNQTKKTTFTDTDEDTSVDFKFKQYNKLNAKGRKKVDDYITDLINTHEYKRKGI